MYCTNELTTTQNTNGAQQHVETSFQICLLFVPEMSAGITSYIVQIIYIALAQILYPGTS
jgi:hypothetical protein